MEPENVSRFYLWLCESAARLAAPANDQIDWLMTKRLPHDELALEFGNDCQLVPQLVQQGFLTGQAAQALQALDAQLYGMSGQESADLWTDEALLESGEWEEVRRLAKAALRQLPGTDEIFHESV